MDPIETFAFVHEGVEYLASVYRDDSMGEPWNEHDGHGPVRWARVSEKGPGERVLSDASRYEMAWLYDYAQACSIARRDKWGVSPGPNPGESVRAYAARAAEADYRRMRAWCLDKWHWVGVAVQRIENGSPDGNPFDHALWGIESDSGDEYLREVASELAY